MLQVFVVSVWLESQLVFERHRERNDQVQTADLGQKVLFTLNWIIVAFLSVYPDQACEML